MLSTDTELHRLSYEDVMRMVEAGVLRDEDRVELVDGVLVDMLPPGPDHSAIVAWLNGHFARASDKWEVRVQDLLIVEGGFLMPDLMVIEPPLRGRHPSTALLVVEVAVTTQRHDRWKAERYAAAGVDEYWLLDLPARTLTAHRQPARGTYEEIHTYGDGDRVEAQVGAPPIDLGELFGPAR